LRCILFPASESIYDFRPIVKEVVEGLAFLEPEGKVGYRWGRDGME